MATYLADIRTANLMLEAELFEHFELAKPVHGKVPIARYDVKKGDRVFFLQCEKEPHGIVASGYVRFDRTPPFRAGESVQVALDQVLRPDEVSLNHQTVKSELFDEFGWIPTNPAAEMSEEMAEKLELAWSESVQKAADLDPPWTREELILLLHFFTRQDIYAICPKKGLFRGCCISLNNLPFKTRGNQSRRHRDPGTTFMKMMQYARWDPRIRAKELTSDEDATRYLSNWEDRVVHLGYFTAGHDDDLEFQKETYLEFYSDHQRLKGIAKAIRLAAQHLPEAFSADHFEEDFVEGHVLTYVHRKLESDPIAKEAKRQSLSDLSDNLCCEICGFDFSEVYGNVGLRFSEFHHTLPLEELNCTEVAKPENLLSVCSNCHRMLHRKDRSYCRERVTPRELSIRCSDDRRLRENTRKSE